MEKLCFTFTSIKSVKRFNSIFSLEILFYLNFASFTFQIAATFFFRMPEYILVSRIPENTNSCGVIRLVFFILFELSIHHFYFDLKGYTNLYSKPHLYATDSKKINKKPPNLSSAPRSYLQKPYFQERQKIQTSLSNYLQKKIMKYFTKYLLYSHFNATGYTKTNKALVHLHPWNSEPGAARKMIF